MTLAVTLGLLVASLSPITPSADDPSPATSGCWVEPLQLSLADLAAFGRIQEQYTRSHCLRQPGASLAYDNHRSLTVGETELGNFWLFGEQVGVKLDVVVFRGQRGEPDRMVVVPALRLPEQWMWAIDRATYPVLIVGGAAIVTTVILDLARHH